MVGCGVSKGLIQEEIFTIFDSMHNYKRVLSAVNCTFPYQYIFLSWQSIMGTLPAYCIGYASQICLPLNLLITDKLHIKSKLFTFVFTNELN
jgi:hypothetical protein